MGGNQLDRFDRWARKLPPHAALLVQLVTDEIVPEFEAHGFQRFPDYAGNSAYAIGANNIALQRRSGERWPTVEIQFDKRCRPAFNVVFSWLPAVCRRIKPSGSADVPRIEANVVEGDAFFMLNRPGSYGGFGYRHFSIFPKRKIWAEIEALKAVLPGLFERLDAGMPAEWINRVGVVDPHAFANFGAVRLDGVAPAQG